jgi:hypothetical protein
VPHISGFFSPAVGLESAKDKSLIRNPKSISTLIMTHIIKTDEVSNKSTTVVLVVSTTGL